MKPKGLKPGKILLPPNRPNIGIEVAYSRAIHTPLREMREAFMREVLKAYRSALPDLTPQIAHDASPIAQLIKIIDGLTREWRRTWMTESGQIAAQFLKTAQRDAEGLLQRQLSAAGFSIRFNPSQRMQRIMHLAANENARLIRSVSERYLSDVAGAVLRSALRGGDLGALTRDLNKKYGIAQRHAAFIASDQNRKINAVVTRDRRIECGITQAIWRHSGGGKSPRPSHVAAGREQRVFDLKKGCLIDGEYLLPGEAPNCRCTSRAIISALTP